MTQTPLTAHVSVFKGSTDTTVVETIPLAEVLQRIQNGTYQQDTEWLRGFLASGDDASYKLYKGQSMAFTPCCAMRTRAKKTPWTDKLISTTGLVYFDLDHLGNPDAVKHQLAQDRHIVFAFVSPSAHGLKIGIAASGITGPDDYKHAWQVILDHLKQTYPGIHLNEDRHVKYLNALCYVSYDPTLYMQGDAIPFVVPPPAPKPAPAPRTTADTADYSRVTSALASIPNNDASYDDWLLLGMALHSTGEAWARNCWDGWSRQSSKFDEEKQEKSWRSFSSDGQVTIASLFHLAKQAGWRPSRATLLVKGQRPVPDMTQTSSPAAQEAPHVQINPGDRLAALLSNTTPAAWYDPEALDTLTCFRRSPPQWGQIKEIFKSYYGNARDLEKAVDAVMPPHEQPAKEKRNSSRSEPETVPSSLLAQDIAGHWHATMVFDLGRQAFMKYGVVPGIFRELEEAEIDADIRTRLEQLLPEGFSASKLRDVKYLLKTHLHTRMASGPSVLVPFANGVLDISSLQWHDHSPEYRLTWRLPYDYDKAATCPQTQAWLLEACSGHKDQVETIRAYLRAVLCGRTDLQRFLELVGPGGSGKGTLTRLAQALVGLENVAVTELKYLESNRFETSNLIHKRLIIITDAEQWASQVSTLKALTGGDSLRVERKHVGKHPRAVAEGMIIVAANEPVTSADYTSGLERRRLPLPFLHRPKTWRNLLEIKGDHFEGALVDELAGIVNWVLAMSEDAMVQYLLHTDTVAPSLADSHALTLVQTNPLAAWADERLVLDPAPGVPVDKTSKPASVKVGIARLAEHTNRYECEDIWLYPNYVAYCASTGTRALSSRRFTALLKDLLVVQLRCSDVDHKTTNKGSQFVGIRFRTTADDENTSHIVDEYCPKTPFLITGHHHGGSPENGEGSSEGGEGSSEVFYGVDYGSEGSEASTRARYVGNNGNGRGAEEELSFLRARIGRNGDTSHTSLPALARGNTSLDPSLDPSPPHSTAPPVVGDWAWLLSTDGVQQNAEPYLVKSIEQGPDGHWYALFLEIPNGWRVERCERAPDPPSPLDGVSMNGQTPADACLHCGQASAPDMQPQADGSVLLRCPACKKIRSVVPIPAGRPA